MLLSARRPDSSPPRDSRSAAHRHAPGWRRAFPLSAVFLLFLIAGLLALLSLPAAAQGPQPPDLRVMVSTDKPVYEPGERVFITVEVTNPLDREQVLRFTSSQQADYTIDDAYRWSDGRAFLTVTTSLTLPPRGTYVFPVFEHRPGDYYLAPGTHTIVAGVVDHVSGVAVISVQSTNPTPAPFLLSPSITPSPAPFGAPVKLAVTVTNVSDSVATFGHDGCPVRYTIDDYYSPGLQCAEYWRQVILKPGESVEFNADEYGYLLLGQPGFILTPGWHSVSFEVPGAGTAVAPLQVTGGGGSIGGHVYAADGTPMEHATVQAIAFSRPDSAVAATWPLEFIHQAVTGADGSYRMENLPPDVYFARAYRFDTGEIWYDGVARWEEATPITLTEGASVEGIDFVLRSTPPEPVFHTYISGTVTNEPPPGSKQAVRPIVGAQVAVLRIASALDSGWVVPGDSTSVPPGGGDPVTGKLDGPEPPVRPPQPPIAILSTFQGITDSLGRYEIPVPPGRYRALAGAPGYRYEWYQEASSWLDADDAIVNNDLTDMIPIPTSFSLADLPADSAEAVITGIVRGYPPLDSARIVPTPLDLDSLPGVVPIEGARVTARPLLENPLLMNPGRLVHVAVTGPGGAYEIRLPAGSPVIVRAAADGCAEQLYDHVPVEVRATPVDLAPGALADGIDFDLMQTPLPSNVGSITGVVLSVDPRYRDCERCMPQPLPGALVRARLAGAEPGREFTTLTDQNGRFALNGLPLGPEFGSLAYHVSAEAPGHLPAYHPGVYRWEEATTVVPTPPWIQTFASTAITLPLQVQAETGPFFAVGLVYGAGGWVDSLPAIDLLKAVAGDSTNPGLPDSTGPFWPLGGAFLYLVDADDETAAPVAGGAASDNGTLVLRNLPAGLYRAYADRPGFTTGWFHGTGPQDAAVISIGEGIDPVLIHIRLTPAGAAPEPGGGDATQGAAEARIVVNLHNSPNPFKPQTTIIYRLMSPADVSVHVFDVKGRLVRTLFDGLRQEAGEQRVPWDGCDDRGRAAGSGIYFYLVKTPGQSSTGKMVMVR